MLLDGQKKNQFVDKYFSLLHKNQDTTAYINSIGGALVSMDVTSLYWRI